MTFDNQLLRHNDIFYYLNMTIRRYLSIFNVSTFHVILLPKSSICILKR